LPGKTEGFGLVLLEGAAQACPSIVTRVGGMPEVVRHEETGLVIEEADLDGLTAGLRNLFANRSLRDEMGRRAYEHAKTFTWDACARATYRAILKGY
jgi:phosphatidylinositol alpha-1,6-mannosyltransferase